MIFYQAFEQFGPAFDSITTPDALHAFYLTILVAAIAVPLNTVFGVGCALLLVRTNFRGKALINAIIDLPFAISPVVIGLSLLLVYSRTGWFGAWLDANGFQVAFAVPGMVLATIFVTLPFVVREVVPVLHEIGDEQEQAARTLGANWWQTFWRVTLPAIRWGVGYGVVSPRRARSGSSARSRSSRAASRARPRRRRSGSRRRSATSTRPAPISARWSWLCSPSRSWSQ